MAPDCIPESLLSFNKRSQVFTARFDDPKGVLYAVKKVAVEDTTELNIIKSISNANIIKTFNIYLTPKFVYFQQELYDNHLDFGNFKYEPVKPDSINDCETINSNINSKIKQMISALKYLHLNDIIHRDIKPSNFLIKDELLVLSDFDTSYKLTNDYEVDENSIFNSNLIGTPLFLAPELLKSSFRSLNNNRSFIPPFLKKKSNLFENFFKLDIYSLGITLYYLIYNTYPFNGDNEYSVQHEIINKEPVFPKTKISHRIVKVLDKLLKKNVNNRWSLDQIENYLQLNLPPSSSSSILPNIITLQKDLNIDISKMNENHSSLEQFTFKLPMLNLSTSSSLSKSKLKHSKVIDFKKFLKKDSSNQVTMNDYFNTF